MTDLKTEPMALFDNARQTAFFVDGWRVGAWACNAALQGNVLPDQLADHRLRDVMCGGK